MFKRYVTDVSLGILFFILVILTYFQNYKYNDNSKDWLNHDYCLNLMKSVTTNTVLMTEGGDNQVFGIAYFQMVEFKRPDVVAYDQKGNVFKRIYGDLRYINPAIIQPRFDVVDYNIVNGKEPFYISELGTKGEPSFIPYEFKGQLGKKNIYMTWTGKELWKYGDYYFKQYGMMHRVNEARYFIVDKLKEYKSLPISFIKEEYRKILIPSIDAQKVFEVARIMEYEGYLRIVSNKVFANASKPFVYTGGRDGKLLFNEIVKSIIYENASKSEIIVDVNTFANLASFVKARASTIFEDVFRQVITSLQREGYISVRGDRVVFVRDYEHPSGLDTLDYHAFYKKRWEETPLSVWWDYLTREIATSYNFTLGSYYFNKFIEYKANFNKIEQPYRDEFLSRISEYSNIYSNYLENAIKYGHDMAPIYFNSAMIYYRFAKENLSENNIEQSKINFSNALKLLKEAAIKDMFAFYVFEGIVGLTLEYANLFASPEEEQKLLSEAEFYISLAGKNISYLKKFREVKGDLNKIQEYQRIGRFKSVIESMRRVSKLSIIQLENSLNSVKSKEEKANLYLQLANAYFERNRFFDPNALVRVKEHFRKYIELKENKDMNFYRTVVNYYLSLEPSNISELLRYASEGLRRGDKYMNFFVALAYDRKGDSDNAYKYYTSFVDEVQELRDSNEYKYALSRISQIKSAKK